MIAAACGSPTVPDPVASGSPPAAAARTPTGSGGPSPTAIPSVASTTPVATQPEVLAATVLGVRLPAGLSRTVALVDGTTLLVLGGLQHSGTTGVVLRLDPTAGTVIPAGTLADAVHDAAGAVLGGELLVLGGGRTLAVAGVQRVTSGGGASIVTSLVGALPEIRADHVAIAIGGEILIAGGGHGGIADGRVLATADGHLFRQVATLQDAVRYPAAAAVGGLVYLFGGTTASGDTGAIQAIDPAAGTVRVVGSLPETLNGASAVVAGGRILIAGGIHAGRAVAAILEFDPATGAVTPVGSLPSPRSVAAAAVLGDSAYLVGGEADGQLLDTIIAIHAG